MLPKTFREFAAAAAVALAPLAARAAAPPSTQQPPAQQPPPAPTTAPGARAVHSPGNAEWAKDLADARRRAAAEKKLVFYELDRGETCGECKRMEGLLYPAFDFEALLVGMVPVKINLDSPDGRVLGERYTIQQAPSILITNPDGRLAFLMQGFRNAPDFYSHVRPDLEKYRKFAAQVDAQDVPKLSANEAFKTGSELFARFDYEAARERLNRAATAPDATPALKSSALQGLAAAELQLGRVADSRKTIEQAIAAAPDSDHKQRAELFRAQIPLAENKPDEALALYRRFAKDHPDSKYMDRVKTFIEKLENGGSLK
jgi:tetratricopeptide (TPR) repeat protein